MGRRGKGAENGSKVGNDRADACGGEDRSSEICLGWSGNRPQAGEGKTAHPPPQLLSILLHLPLPLFLLLPSPPFPSCTAGQGLQLGWQAVLPLNWTF